MNAFCYRFRNDDGEMLYIGVTTNIIQRLKSHKAYWTITEPITVDVMPVPADDRYKIETALIRRYRPTENHFVAQNDNEYWNVAEQWIPFATIHPTGNCKLGKLVLIQHENMEAKA